MKGNAKFWLAGALLVFGSGCASGYVSTGGYVEPGVVYAEPMYVDPWIPAPDVYVFRGFDHPYYHHYAHDYSHRGFEGRRFNHSGHVGGAPGFAHGAGRGGFHGPFGGGNVHGGTHAGDGHHR